MFSFEKSLAKAVATAELSREELCGFLNCCEPEPLRWLYRAAYGVKLKNCGNRVSLRGLIEMSNVCSRDCYYCGIRKSNSGMKRYTLSIEEILSDARLADDFGYGSVVLQGGERSDAAFTAFVAEAVRAIKEQSQGRLGITLSLGEQTPETYRSWFEAGAHRYLLRIETSNPELFRKLHPADSSYENRLACLSHIREAGYQLGTGVMIALPGQTTDDLAADLEFFKKLSVDMVGMGPYLVQKDTPLAREFPDFEKYRSRQLEMGLKMIALLRLTMPDINIASTTALQTLAPDGRERGLLAGANVIMPNIGDLRYRRSYQLYDDKAGLDENAPDSRRKLEESLAAIGEEIAYGEWGDSRHFVARHKN